MLEQEPTDDASIESLPFLKRHIGPSDEDQMTMLLGLSQKELEVFVEEVVPKEILDAKCVEGVLPEGCSEFQSLQELRDIANQNKVFRSLIGLGYFGTFTPSLIQRHVLENPAWYTAYTPYQAEISQGRLEALFNFQTFISELCGLPVANASLLDEATAAAEAMALSLSVCKRHEAKTFLVDEDVYPQTLAVLSTRAEPLGIEIEIAPYNKFVFGSNVFGCFIQLPSSSGLIFDVSQLVARAHQEDSLVTVAIDPLAQVLLQPIGSLGVDIAVGSAQRLGVPIGFGGPHAAFFATHDRFKRQIPGRLVGQSIDLEGQPALRLALQTREQHIRREKATSNICTAQVLLAVMSSFYVVHHGPEGLEVIARRIASFRLRLEKGLIQLGYSVKLMPRFDTVEVLSSNAPEVHRLASLAGFNLRVLPLGASIDNAIGFGVTFDELSTNKELQILLDIFAKAVGKSHQFSNNMLDQEWDGIPLRTTPWLKQNVFHLYRSETELLRYIQNLVSKDFSLVHGMIPLGSCTMKLNATSELLPISWRKFSAIHPFAPINQVEGYIKLFHDLEKWLAALTGFSAVSLQPNAGSQGEFAGLLVIRAWHESRGEKERDICLIPSSAHGTNPASSVMAGFKVVSVACDKHGNIDLEDLENKAKKYTLNLGAIMVTYPSTHGVFEPKIREICDLAHKYGAQVYLDGANLNAQIGLARPGAYGADVCHLNLHKTFCIPHGGGGPGVGPIAVGSHLVQFLPGHPLATCGGHKSIGAVSAAPWGSAGILPISWMYLRMMGSRGLRKASSVALLSANYIAERLHPFYPVLYRGLNGRVAHECILDLRDLKRTAGVDVEDIAKRLMDYGFHAPTINWPVSGTLMVEPTESESLIELMRFCDAMIAIRQEIAAIESGLSDREKNPLRCAPHTLAALTADEWDRPYTRREAAYPLAGQKKNKIWPAVARIQNAFGDRNLVCTCPAVEDFEKGEI